MPHRALIIADLPVPVGPTPYWVPSHQEFPNILNLLKDSSGTMMEEKAASDGISVFPRCAIQSFHLAARNQIFPSTCHPSQFLQLRGFKGYSHPRAAIGYL